MREDFHNPPVMLFNQLWAVLSYHESSSDAQPSVRPNLGTGFIPTLFGLRQEVFEDKMPWLKEHLTKEQISRFRVPDDVSHLGLMPHAKKCIDYFKAKQDGKFAIFLPDTQGPFDIAHLVRGDDLFTDLVDDPPFVHHLMTLCVEMYIKATRRLKEWIGEPLDSCHHSGNLYLARGGVRCCEDTTTLLSPRHIDEFVAPYMEKALAAFGGGWVHYCGNNTHLLETLIERVPHAHGINFGNPERHDFAKIFPRLVEKGKFYFGGWAKTKEESTEQYFRRIIAPVKSARRGLIFIPSGVSAKTPAEAEQLLRLWQGAHTK
jgi:uroporphyrinogen-III decarboxylase